MNKCGISEAEIDYIQGGFDVNCRVDGRKNLQYRSIEMSTNCIPVVFGSSRITNDESNILTCISGEIGLANPAEKNSGKIFVDVSYTTTNERRKSAETSFKQSLELSQLISKLMLNDFILDFSKLTIVDNLLVWYIYVDVTIFCSGGSLIDLISMSILAAINSSEFPDIKISLGTSNNSNNLDGTAVEDMNTLLKNWQQKCENEYKMENLFQLHDITKFDINPSKMNKILCFDCIPIIMSVGVYYERIIFDLTYEEEQSVHYITYVSIDIHGNLLGVEFKGKMPFEMNTIDPILHKIKSVSQKTLSDLSDLSFLNKFENFNFNLLSDFA